MRILHTSDWHLGKRLKQFYRLDEQKETLNEIIEISKAENVDAVIISGDIYDNIHPPVEATELLYRTLKDLSEYGKKPVIVLAGNHDSPDMVEVSDPLARELGIFTIGYPKSVLKPIELSSGLKLTKSDESYLEFSLSNFNYPLRIVSLPYSNELRLKEFLGFTDTSKELEKYLANRLQEICEKYCDNSGVNILAAHQFFMAKSGEKPEESDDERSIMLGGTSALNTAIIPDNIQYSALGHIHKKWEIEKGDSPVIYCGSPLAYSFNETNQNKYVVVVETEPAAKTNYKFIRLETPVKLLKNTFNNIDDAENWLIGNPDSYIEMTLETDDYISANDKKRLLTAHKRLVDIIPFVKQKENEVRQTFKLDDDIREIFKLYYASKFNNAVPNEEIMKIFEEILEAED